MANYSEGAIIFLTALYFQRRRYNFSHRAIFACEGAIFFMMALSLPTKAQSISRRRYTCLHRAIPEAKSMQFFKNWQFVQ